MSMMTFASAQQRLMKPAEVAVQRGPMLSTPLAKPLGAQRRAMHTLASSFDAPRPSSQFDPSSPSFVRPDCPPVSDDEGSASDGSIFAYDTGVTPPADTYRGEPKFRSALEQVSYMTSAQAEGDNSSKNGVLGLGLFGL